MSHVWWLGVGRWMFRVGVEWSWPWGMVECKGGKYSFCGWRTVGLFGDKARDMYTLCYFGPFSIAWARRVA
ncbi:hypothetical protein DDE01_11830 [Desulfovibrio desulfuricans]|nr:hypothetical protein DDE01_11830 [Desulfovibrio desulfuricans]